MKADPNNESISSGRVVAAHGRHAVVEDHAHNRYHCAMKGRRLRPVCADEVRWRLEQTDVGDGVVVEILPRRTELARPDRRGRTEVIASNMSQIVVVIAPQPEPDYSLVDRYLVAAELVGVSAAVVGNKSDIATLNLAGFAALGYLTVTVSACQPDGLAPLMDLLSGQTSILVGQSGVGKSSLLNAMIPGLDSRTQTLSDGSGEGRHTTTASILHHLGNGGEVIDSPGVRDYAPPPVSARQLATGFIEFAEAASQCRFADCRHLAEPDCGVKAALEHGGISRRRYESYCHLVERLAAIDPDNYS
ncbi:MAG: ribosome small subunit-dependent GTPase A [Gammaproteobacteria bacterium]|nr:ribosome small subunit-dependent GTPase A [Gammaproteobacteria bacterium]NNF61466.1 ribosome small subunit-dependent GTPase A [Gammaproteobacteria bacterium]